MAKKSKSIKQRATRISETSHKLLSGIVSDSRFCPSIPMLLDRAVQIAEQQLKKEYCNGAETHK